MKRRQLLMKNLSNSRRGQHEEDKLNEGHHEGRLYWMAWGMGWDSYLSTCELREGSPGRLIERAIT